MLIHQFIISLLYFYFSLIPHFYSRSTQINYDSNQSLIVSDFIREIRQANKTCEEGLISKVKSMVEEKLNQRSSEMVNLNVRIKLIPFLFLPELQIKLSVD